MVHGSLPSPNGTQARWWNLNLTCAAITKKVSYMRNPPIKIYHKINKDTSGGRIYGRRELKKRLKVELHTK